MTSISSPGLTVTVPSGWRSSDEGHDALGLVADIDDDFGLGDLQDMTAEELAFGGRGKVAVVVDELLEVLGRRGYGAGFARRSCNRLSRDFRTGSLGIPWRPTGGSRGFRFGGGSVTGGPGIAGRAVASSELSSAGLPDSSSLPEPAAASCCCCCSMSCSGSEASERAFASFCPHLDWLPLPSLRDDFSPNGQIRPRAATAAAWRVQLRKARIRFGTKTANSWIPKQTSESDTDNPLRVQYFKHYSGRPGTCQPRVKPLKSKRAQRVIRNEPTRPTVLWPAHRVLRGSPRSPRPPGDRR